MERSAVHIEEGHKPQLGENGTVGIRDTVLDTRSGSRMHRLVLLGASLVAGAFAGYLIVRQAHAYSVLPILCALAFVGGLLSTWSPCGYSSLSLLRPARYGGAQLAGWAPTLITHGLGYAAGALVLGGALGFATWLLPMQGFAKASLIGLGLVAVAYALHQFRLIRMPYPQRRAQVPHDARVRFPMWQTGLLYGFALGMNFLTYVRTPILYLVVLGALVSGSVSAAIILFMALNLGRFLPLLVNLLPMHDWTVQRWLASNEHRALTADAVALSFTGAILLVLGLA